MKDALKFMAFVLGLLAFYLLATLGPAAIGHYVQAGRVYQIVETNPDTGRQVAFYPDTLEVIISNTNFMGPVPQVTSVKEIDGKIIARQRICDGRGRCFWHKRPANQEEMETWQKFSRTPQPHRAAVNFFLTNKI